MRVAVEVTFVQSCPDCRRVVAELARSCAADATVTGFRMLPGRKHAHEVTEGAAALPGLTAGAAEPPSDTNGAEPGAVESALFPDDGPDRYAEGQ